MSALPPRPKSLTLAWVDEVSSSLPSSSSSTSEGAESMELHHDTAAEVPLQPEGGALQRSKAGDDATCFGNESGIAKTKYGAALYGGHSSLRGGALPGPGLMHERLQPHALVSNPHHSKIYQLWASNRSCSLVILAVFFGSAMTLFTKMLETGQHAMHPFKILFLRMSVTSILCFVPLYCKKDGGSPLGPKNLRWLLAIRGISGFFGLCGIWMSIRFLDLADATVITFLTPSMVAIFSVVFLKQPFTRKEQLASLLAILGVVFIARPAVLFGNPDSVVTDSLPSMTATEEKALASDRLAGTVLALISATGGTGAIIAIRTIRGRVSILTTTLYFAMTCTVVSGMALVVAPWIDYDQPDMRFGLAEGSTEWLLMVGIVISGLLTQLFMTEGLGGETKSNKAPAMVYTGMLWTAGFDRWVFGETMYWSSVVGCTLIVGGAIWMVLQPKPTVEAEAGMDRLAHDVDLELGAATATSDEAAPMVMELRQGDEAAGKRVPK